MADSTNIDDDLFLFMKMKEQQDSESPSTTVTPTKPIDKAKGALTYNVPGQMGVPVYNPKKDPSTSGEAALDVVKAAGTPFDMATRAAGALRSDESFGEALDNPESNILAPEIKQAKEYYGGLRDKAVKDANPKAAMFYEAMYQAADKIAPQLGDPTLLAGGVAKGLNKTADLARVSEGGFINERLATGIKTPISAAKETNERALYAYTQPGGKEKFKAAYEGLDKTSEKFNKVVFDNEDFINKHEAVIKPILAEVKDIDPNPIFNALEKNIDNATTDTDLKRFNKLLQNKINELKRKYGSIDETTGLRKPISGTQYREMRKDLDREINWEGIPKDIKSKADKAFIDARGQARQSLIDATPEKYAADMEIYTSGFDALDEAKLIFGKNEEMANLTTPEKILRIGKGLAGDTERLNAVKRLDKQFGTNFEEMFTDAANATSSAKPGFKEFKTRTGFKMSAGVLRAAKALGSGEANLLELGADVSSGMSKAARINAIAESISRLDPKSQFELYKAADAFNKAKTPEQKQKAQEKINSLSKR